jgi:predicted DNA-binding transcriptional regulator AlpA
MTKLDRAKALAEAWAEQGQHAKREAAVCSYFAYATPSQIIAMWESGKNLQGRALSQFETQALAEAWCRVFGELPPDCSEDGEPDPPPEPEPELPADDTMLSAKDVVRLTGVSLATVKRMVIDGRFPVPLRPTPRRIGWPARDVRLWLEGLDGARRKVRT